MRGKKSPQHSIFAGVRLAICDLNIPGGMKSNERGEGGTVSCMMPAVTAHAYSRWKFDKMIALKDN